jgi:hypothetical protein
MTNTEYPSYEYRNNLKLKTTMQINGFENSNPRIKQTLTKPNRFGGIIVSILASSEVDRRFEP